MGLKTMNSARDGKRWENKFLCRQLYWLFLPIGLPKERALQPWSFLQQFMILVAFRKSCLMWNTRLPAILRLPRKRLLYFNLLMWSWITIGVWIMVRGLLLEGCIRNL